MNISDIRTRIESGADEQSFLATRSEPNEAPVLTLVDSPEPSAAEACVKPDPLIQALVDKLPKPGTIWSIDDRARWLKVAAMAFNLTYRTDEGNEADLKIEKPTLNVSRTGPAPHLAGQGRKQNQSDLTIGKSRR
jgi:hypothetical protein